jgi:hypothetical protein
MHPLIATFTARAALTFDGVFTTSSGSSPVTSATRTIIGTGTLLFNNISGGGDPEYSKNGGAFTNITEAMTLAMTSGDTLAVRRNDSGIPGSTIFDIRNNSGSGLIEAVTLERT